MKFQPKLRHVVTLMKVNFTFLNPWSVSQKYFSAWNYMASFLQNIIEEMQRIHELGQTYTLNKLNAHLKHDLLTDEDISRICDAVKESDLFSICHEGPMRTVYSRTQAFKKMFKYAEPVKVYLGRDETRSLWNVCWCLTYGRIVSYSIHIRQNPTCLKLILYQDAFEVVNPLGSAKNQHKVLAMYFSLANLRSNTDHVT